MCVGSVCTKPPYNDKNPTSVFFVFFSTKIFTPFSNWNRAVCPCDVTRTEDPPTIVDWQQHFSTDCTGVLPQTRHEWAVVSCFTTRQCWKCHLWHVAGTQQYLNHTNRMGHLSSWQIACMNASRVGLLQKFTFTFMHLADTFIQSDLQCICNPPDTGPHQLTERVANPGLRRGRRAL